VGQDLPRLGRDRAASLLAGYRIDSRHAGNKHEVAALLG